MAALRARRPRHGPRQGPPGPGARLLGGGALFQYPQSLAPSGKASKASKRHENDGKPMNIHENIEIRGSSSSFGVSIRPRRSLFDGHGL